MFHRHKWMVAEVTSVNINNTFLKPPTLIRHDTKFSLVCRKCTGNKIVTVQNAEMSYDKAMSLAEMRGWGKL